MWPSFKSLFPGKKEQMSFNVQVDNPEPQIIDLSPQEGKVTHMAGRVLKASGNNEIYKSVIPEFLYKPPFGYPRAVNIPELRRLAAVPYCEAAVSTIVDEVSAVTWDIVPKKDTKGSDLGHISTAKSFFEKMNSNEEDIDTQLQSITRDIIHIDAGVWVKVFDRTKTMREVYNRDGGMFLKNPDIFGTFRDKEEILPIEIYNLMTQRSVQSRINQVVNDKAAYFQYGWSTNAMPIPFGKREIVYVIKKPRADSVYGRSPIECLMEVLQSLIYAIEHHSEQFTEDTIPQGFIQMTGAGEDEIKEFVNQWSETMKTKDSAGKWRKNFYNIPVTGFEGNFIRLGWSNQELELIQQQEWFAKLVWACIGITPSELGYTESSNRATEIGQSKVAQRKAVKPILKLLEKNINRNILPELGYSDIMFKFNREDTEEALQKASLYEIQLRTNQKTINEIRAINGDQPLEGGDEIRGVTQPNENGDQKPNNNQSGDELTDTEKGMDEDQGAKIDREARPDKEKEQKGLLSSSSVMMKPGEEIDIEEVLKKKLKVLKFKVLNDIISSVNQKPLGEIKSLTKSDIEAVLKAFGVEDVEAVFRKAIKDAYYKGMGNVEYELDRNFTIDAKTLEFIEDHAFENVKDMSTEIKNKLRAELERSIMNGDSVTKIKAKISKIFNKSMDRSEMIARTETMRAENIGALNAYEQSGIEGKKEWLATIDKNTCDACRRLNGKALELVKPFNDQISGKSVMLPPLHVNCRCAILFRPKNAVV